MERKLASIQKIAAITPIADADRIELAHVLGWQCVAKKGDFKEGDLCIYIEVDAFLPMKNQYAFLASTSYRKNPYMGEGYRIRTQRMRGEISQGLLLPLSVLPDSVPHEIGTDVTDILEIRKWEVPEAATSGGTVIGDMPFGTPKTDETRVQSAPELLAEFAAVDEYYISTKMDGTSMTAVWKDGILHVCGRNCEYKDDEKCDMWKLVHRLRLPDTLAEKYPDRNIVIQGEFCGEGIQKNRLKLKEPHWYIFTMLNAETMRRIPLAEMMEIAENLNLETVSVEETGTGTEFHEKYSTVESLLERAKGTYPAGTLKEGIVIRPTVPVYSPALRGPLSMKILNNDFLVKEK